MSSIYTEDIHKDLKILFPVLQGHIEIIYLCPEDQKGTMLQAKLADEKQNALIEVKELCDSIEHKIELLNYKLQIIQSFDWSKYYNFKKLCEESEEKRVKQVLQDGKVVVSFSHHESMGNYILTEISTFFSILSSVIDNLAEVFNLTFKLNIGGAKRIDNVTRLIQIISLRDFLLNNFCGVNHSFYGMREIRKAFEHKDHRHVIIVERFGAITLVETAGNEKFLGCINIEKMGGFFKNKLNDFVEDNQLVNYCNFLHIKIKDALKQLLVELSNSSPK